MSDPNPRCDDLRALVINCTLKRSPERSHTEPGQFAVYSAVPPGRVLLHQPQRQVADLLAGPRPARLVRVRPLAGDQAAVPGQ